MEMMRVLFVGVVEALAPEVAHEAPVTKARHAGILRQAEELVGGHAIPFAGGIYLVRRAGALVDGLALNLAGEHAGGIHHRW